MILVTGATGMTGAHLLLRLAQRSESVRAIHRPGSDFGLVRSVFSFWTDEDTGRALFDSIRWVEADITDPDSLEEAMAGITEVFHCAALVSFDLRDKDLLFRTNAEGTANVVNAALDAGVSVFHYISSVAAIGRSAHQSEPIDETRQWKNAPENSNYAQSKFLAECEVYRGAEEGMRISIVNPGIILGPGDPAKSSARIFRTVSRGLPRTAPGMNGVVHVMDVADAMLALRDRSITGERFILVSDNIPFHRLASLIAEALGTRPPGPPAPRWAMNAARILMGLWAFVTQSRPLITRETLRAAYSAYTYDSSKISRMADFRFRPAEDAARDGARFFLKFYS